MPRQNTDFQSEGCALRNLLKYANFEGYDISENTKLLVMLKAIIIGNSETQGRGWLWDVVGPVFAIPTVPCHQWRLLPWVLSPHGPMGGNENENGHRRWRVAHRKMFYDAIDEHRRTTDWFLSWSDWDPWDEHRFLGLMCLNYHASVDGFKGNHELLRHVGGSLGPSGQH
jgi:hypothetical protein